MRWLVTGTLLCATLLFAQTPPELSLTLVTSSGQTRYRIGEVIPIQYRFDSTIPGRYEVHNPSNWNDQKFSAQPSEGVVNPVADFPQAFPGMGGQRPTPTPLNGQPVIISKELNGWLAFRKPGRYKISADVRAVTPAGAGSFPKSEGFIPLRSTVLEIELVDDPAWSRARLQEAVAFIEMQKPQPPGIGRGGSMSDFDDQRFAHQLSLLDTRESVLAMVSILARNLNTRIGTELEAGLRRSPYRKEAIAAIEEAIKVPDNPITDSYLGTLDSLVAVTTSNPPDFAKAYNYAYTALAQAFPAKRGDARRVSLGTLARYQSIGPPPPAIADVVFKNYTELPPASQTGVLTDRWLYMSSPAMAPYLPVWAAGSSAGRDAALSRLMDINPVEARPIALTRIRNGDGLTDPADVLLRLPDGLLPEFDGALADALERKVPVQSLVARYASNAILARVRATYESQKLKPCGDLLAYFFRVDPAYATGQVALARAAGSGVACPLRFSPLLMSPGLEAAAIRDLDSTDAANREAAIALLRDGGTSSAKEAFFNHIDRPEFKRALTAGRGWLLTPPELDRIAQTCPNSGDANCDSWIRSAISSTYYQPIPIYFGRAPNFGFRLGGSLDHTFEQLQNKIRSYPPGTAFAFAQLPYASTWDHQYYQEQIRRIIDAAGMKLK